MGCHLRWQGLCALVKGHAFLCTPHFLCLRQRKRAVHGPKESAWPSSGSEEPACGEYGGPGKSPLKGFRFQRWARMEVCRFNKLSATRIGIAFPASKTDLVCFYLRCRCPPSRGRGNPRGRGYPHPPLSRCGVRGEIGAAHIQVRSADAVTFGRRLTPPRFWRGRGGDVFSQKTSPP